MPRRGRRVIRLLLGTMLLLLLAVLGTVAWLYTSGRLATLAQDFLQQLSGQDITFTAVEFTSWHTVALIDVRLQQPLTNGRVDIVCPRLEIHYGLRGLLHKRVAAVRLQQPTVSVHISDDTPDTPTTMQTSGAVQPGTRTIPLLPFTHLIVEQGSLQIHLDEKHHALQQLGVDLRQPNTSMLHVDATGLLVGQSATFHLHGQTPLDVPQPAGSWDLQFQALPLTWIAETFPALVPPDWQVTAGVLDTTAQLTWQTPQQLQGTVTLTAAQLQAEVMSAHLHNGALTSQAKVKVDMAQGTLDVQGSADITAQTIRFGSAQDTAALHIDALRGRVPFSGNTTTVTFPDVQIHTQAWRRGSTVTTPFLPRLVLQTTGALDVRRQQLTLRQFNATLDTLGTSIGSGTLHWGTQTVRDLRLQVMPTTATALWHTLAPFLPAMYREWDINGNTRLELQAPLLALQPFSTTQPLALTWHLQDIAFNSPDGEYAGEHVTATLQATASLETATGRYTLRGTCAIQPFSLLLGTLFPALEEQQVHTVITFSAAYQPHAERLRLYFAGQFGALGTAVLHGHIRQPTHTPQYDLQGVLQNINVGQIWQTFVSADSAVGPAALATTTAQGKLDAVLTFRGPATALRLQGALDLREVHVHTPAVVLEGAALQLPLQLQLPLPQTLSKRAALPTEAYGRLHIDRIRFQGFTTPPLTTRLAMQSDTLVFPDAITLPLLDGEFRLQQLTAQHLLRSSRHITLQAHVQRLNLQLLQRSTAKLPLTGMVDGGFSRIDIRGDRLDTDGALTLRLAGGVVQLTKLQGNMLFSSLPTLRCTLATTQPLSLRQLTDIYPIGSIGGTLHFRVTDLATTAWQPAAFQLIFYVQEKQGETREITLRALNNLLFTTGSAKVETGQTYRLPYKRFGAKITLRHDTLRLRGLYHDNAEREYFMVAPKLGGGVSIINRVPHNGISFRDVLQRLKATVLDHPDVRVK